MANQQSLRSIFGIPDRGFQFNPTNPSGSSMSLPNSLSGFSQNNITAPMARNTPSVPPTQGNTQTDSMSHIDTLNTLNDLANGSNNQQSGAPVDTTPTYNPPSGVPIIPPHESAFDRSAFNPDKYFDPTSGINSTTKAPTTEDLYTIRAALASRQGDVLTRAVNTGIPFNPQQLAQLHQSAAGIYDPALADINARILHSEKMDELNASKTGVTNPDLTNILGDTSTDNNYVLKAGDDPYNIAVQNGTDMNTLKSLNPTITDWTKLPVGTQIKLPVSSTKNTTKQDADLLNQALGYVAEGANKWNYPTIRDAFIKGYKDAPDKTQYVLDQVKSNLNTTELKQFNDKEDVSIRMANVLNAINDGTFKTGRLTSMSNNVKNIVSAGDPYYNDIKSLFSSASAAERLRLFGASLTNNEQKSAKDFLPSDTDRTEVLKFKVQTLQGMADLEKKKLLFQRLGIPTDGIVTDYLSSQKAQLDSLQNGSTKQETFSPTGGVTSSGLSYTIEQ